MATRKLRGFLVDVNNGVCGETCIEDSLEALRYVLNCRMVDVVTRKIGDKYYDIICDDEALLNGTPRISAIDSNREPMLVGSLLIVGLPDEQGEATSLSDGDIVEIKKRMVKTLDGAGVVVCEYE